VDCPMAAAKIAKSIWLLHFVACLIPLHVAKAETSGTIVRRHWGDSAQVAVVEVTESGVAQQWDDMTLASLVSDIEEETQYSDGKANMIGNSQAKLGSSTITASKAGLLEKTGFAAEAFYAGDLEHRSSAELQRLQGIVLGDVNKSMVEVVLAHYNEDLGWTSAYKNILSIYSKSSEDSLPGRIHLPNVGREGHTFLYHIVNNYDNLADWTVFSQAGEPTEGYQGHRIGGGHMLANVSFADYVLHDSKNGNDGSFIFFTSVIDMDTLLVAHRHNYVHKIGSQNPLRCPDDVSGDTWDNFVSLGWFYGYLSKKCNTTTELLSQAFKDYWLQHVSDTIPKGGLVFYAQGARFAMAKERIRQRPKNYYVHLLDLVKDSVDPWANYFNEWTWFYMLGVAPTDPACACLPAIRKTTTV